jgi:hypothetical protein
MPTYTTDHRGQIRILSGDGATTADKLQFARDSSGTGAFVELANLTDAQTLVGKTLTAPTLNDAILGLSVETSGTAPAFAALANAGSTATVANSVGNDTAGKIELTPGGAGIAAGAVVTVTFNQARPDTNYIVLLQAANPGAAALVVPLPRPASLSTTAWTLTRETTALVSGTTYQWNYWVVEF